MDETSAPAAPVYSPVQVMMELAAIAYASDVTAYLDQAKFATAGWQLAWGPAVTDGQANRVYVAKNANANQFAVVVRGTYPEFGRGCSSSSSKISTSRRWCPGRTKPFRAPRSPAERAMP